MPVIGSIIENEKVLVPVYVEGESSSSGDNDNTGSSTTLVSSPVSITGGFYNGTYYALALNQAGEVSSITWDRTSDPIIEGTQTIVPINTIPVSQGFMVTVDPIYPGEVDNEEVFNESGNVSDFSTLYNNINIRQLNDNVSTGTYETTQDCYFTVGYKYDVPSRSLTINFENNNYSLEVAGSHWLNITQYKINNLTSHNLSISLSLTYENLTEELKQNYILHGTGNLATWDSTFVEFFEKIKKPYDIDDRNSSSTSYSGTGTFVGLPALGTIEEIINTGESSTHAFSSAEENSLYARYDDPSESDYSVSTNNASYATNYRNLYNSAAISNAYNFKVKLKLMLIVED